MRYVREVFTSTDIWVKYRKESKQTICIIGVLILSAKLCKADGHFSILEEEEILKTMPHEPNQKKILLKILDEAGQDKNSIEYHAEIINKELLGLDSYRKFIIAFLYRLAHSDHVYSEEEDEDIRKVAKIFNIKKTFVERSFIEFKNLFQKKLNA
tara:strand:+ start:106 stop:570 length:465 start_codon:yes stop_codon:yes gene_type:complete